MDSKKFLEISEDCHDWIDWTAHDRNIKIQSALHGGVEKKIRNYKVDGFCQKLNTVFEFYGNYWHAHPDLFLMRMPNTQLESMMTKIKLLLPRMKLETTFTGYTGQGLQC